MKTLQELQPLIIEWSKEKNIHLEECAPKQRLKLIEKCGELASAILKSNVELQKDAIGDIFVVLVILNEQMNITKEISFKGKGIFGTDFFYIINKIINSKTDDCYSYLKLISILLGFDLTECANIAWNEIKDRKGNTVNGTFIKN